MNVYRALAQDPRVVAIGECGLDNYRPEDVAVSAPLQRKVFEAHMALAAEVGKPLMIHARPAKGTQDAYRDLVDLVREGKRTHGDALSGNVHFFVGGIDEARSIIDLGFTVSYTAVLAFARDYDEVVRFLPLDRILTETDAPYAAPPPNRGRRNDPRAVEQVVEAIAGIRGEDPEAVRTQVLVNARQAFRI
jgi:TatD DNase family protein